MSFFPIEKRVSQYLKQEGFSEEEIFIITTLLEKRAFPKNHKIFESAKHKQAIDTLVNKNLIRYFANGGDEMLSIDSLEVFFHWIRNNAVDRINNIKERSEDIIDLLRNNLGGAVKSKFLFFEGVEGIKDSYHHILKHAEKETLAYYSIEETVQPELQSFLDLYYSTERAKKNIFSRNITTKTPYSTYLKLRSQEFNSETRWAPAGLFPIINTEINLYGDFMQCMFFDENNAFALILEDKNIVSIQKAIFEMAWNSCKIGLSERLCADVPSESSLENLQKHIYLTDNIDSILKIINSRKDKFTPDLKEKWSTARPEFLETKEGEKIIRICDLEVMSDLEKPYVKKLAKIATIHGGNILDIGYYFGFTADYVENYRNTRQINEHHIIEPNKYLFERAQRWRNNQKHKDKIFLHQGYWEDVLLELKFKNCLFDGVLFNGYPLEVDEICRTSINFLYSVLRLNLVKEKEGIITFYMDSVDGFGNSFYNFLQLLGVNDVRTEKVDIKLPNRVCEYWNESYFLAPMLTNIKY